MYLFELKECKILRSAQNDRQRKKRETVTLPPPVKTVELRSTRTAEGGCPTCFLTA